MFATDREKLMQGPFKRLRLQAWERFEQLGLAITKDERYRSLRLNRKSAEQSVATSETISQVELQSNWLIPESHGARLVVVDGRWSPELSDLSELPDTVHVKSLTDSLGTYGTFLQSHWKQSIKIEEDPFAVANAAMHGNGIFVYVRPNEIIETPIHVLHVITDATTAKWAFPRIHAVVGQSAEVSFMSSHAFAGQSNMQMNVVADIHVDENARCTWDQLPLQLGEESWISSAVRVQLKRHARFHSTSFTDGCGMYREDYGIQLSGEGADADIAAGWLLDTSREAHYSVKMHHQAPHCTSSQLFKGANDDLGRSSFYGKIYVDDIAQKTDAFQLNNNLLLSERARADTKPNLEIFADDVKASHGATVGRLDPDQLLYLQTRGCTPAVAKQLLVGGYLKQVAERYTVASARERVLQQIDQQLDKRAV